MRSSMLLMLPLACAAGCNLIPTATNSYWIYNEKNELTLGASPAPDTRQMRYFSLVAEVASGEDTGPLAKKDFGATAIAVGTTLAVQGARMLYDYVVNTIEDEAKLYHRSYSDSADMSPVWSASGWKTAGFQINASDMAQWFNQIPVPGVVVPDAILKEWPGGNPALSMEETALLAGLYKQVTEDFNGNTKTFNQPPKRPVYHLFIHTAQVQLSKDQFSFTRTASGARDSKGQPTINVEGRLKHIANTSEGYVELTSATFMKAAAKIPDEHWWIPVDLVDDQLESRVDIAIKVRVDYEHVDAGGRLVRETLLDEPLAQFNGVPLPEGDKSATLLSGKTRRSRGFLLPPVTASNLPDPRQSLRITLSIDEHNQMGDYLQKAVERAKDKREEVLDSIEKNVKKLLEDQLKKD